MVLKQHNCFGFIPFRIVFALILPLPHLLRKEYNTLNIHGARDIQKRILSKLNTKNIDVMYVQESDCSNTIDWEKEWEGKVVITHMSSSRGGGAVLFANLFIFCLYYNK